MTDPVNTEPTVDESAPVDDPTTAVNEAASDAELRAWAKENGIEGVPASGKLAASWREIIVNAMAVALDPKEEASAEATSTSEPSTPPATTMATDSTPAGESSSVQTETEVETEPVWEYRSVFQPPNTFVSSQAYTS